MTNSSPLTARTSAKAPSERDVRFLISLTVFPAAFDLAAAAAVSSRDAEEVCASVTRLLAKKFLRTVKATAGIRLWVLNSTLRKRLIQMPNTREVVSRARTAHEEYFLRALRGVDQRPRSGDHSDPAYLEYLRANLELAASRRIRRLVGVGGGVGGARVVDNAEPSFDLTTRQWEVAKLVANGLTNYQIAHALGIAEWTAVNHVRAVMRRLGCGSRVDVARVVLAGQPPRALESERISANMR